MIFIKGAVKGFCKITFSDWLERKCQNALNILEFIKRDLIELEGNGPIDQRARLRDFDEVRQQ